MMKPITNTIHELKTWPEYFQKVKSGDKTFELRKDDRNFQVGETLLLLEYDNVEEKYTGDMCLREITYKLEGGNFGLQEGYCILGLSHSTVAGQLFDNHFDCYTDSENVIPAMTKKTFVELFKQHFKSFAQ